MILFTAILFAIGLIPFPVYTLVIASGIGLPFLVIIHGIIAYNAHKTALRFPEFGRVFVGGIVGLPVALIVGVFIHFGDQVDIFNGRGPSLEQVYGTRLLVFTLILLTSFIVGNAVFYRTETMTDKQTYSLVVKKVTLTTLILLAIAIVGTLVI